MAVAVEVKNQRVIENSVQCTKQSFFFGEILTPGNGLFVACKNNIRTTFLVVAAVNQVEEKSCVFSIKNTVSDLINNQTGWFYRSVNRRRSFTNLDIPFPGCSLSNLRCHRDERGYFMETYNRREMAEFGLNGVFVQDNQSLSAKGVLRGLHFQKHHPQETLVRVIRGTVFDVAVDLRVGSGLE